MKKTLLVAAFALAGTFAFAQKPTAGSKTAEVNLNFQTGGAPVGYTLPGMGATPELRLRYFLSDEAAVRIRVGLGSNTTKTNVQGAPGSTVSSDVTTKSGFALTLYPGYEIHMEGTSKLSPYYGAQLGIMLGGGGSKDVTNSNSATPGPGNITSGDKYSEKMGSTFGLSLGLMMGADYYIADGVFIGGEFGLGLFSMTSTGEGSKDVTTGSNTVTTKTGKSSTTDIFGVTPTGNVRLGFVF